MQELLKLQTPTQQYHGPNNLLEEFQQKKQWTHQTKTYRTQRDL